MMRFLARLLAAILFLTLAVDASAAEAATRPSAPRSVKATPGISSVKVSWAAPASNGGATIDRYAVQRRSSTTASWVTVKRTTGAARSWTNTGLTNGRRYYFRVIAHNRRGNSPPSATVSAVPRTVPSSPRTLAADTRLLSFSMGWQASLSNGGARIDFYLVEISKDGATWTTPKVWKTDGSSPVPLFTGLTAGTQYWFRIRAHNAAGYSVSTGAGPYRAHTTTNPVTDPVAQAGDGQVSLTWTKPTSNLKDAGIPAASTYKVDQSSDGGTTWTLATETENTSATVTELSNGTAYLFRVRSGTAITNLPFAAPSPSVAATPMGAPTVPRNVALVWDPIAEDYALTWAPPANDGGTPRDRYELQHWNAGTPPPYTTTVIGADTTSAPAGPYALQDSVHIRACNGPDEADCGPWSTPVGPVPGAVVASSAIPGRDETGAIVTLAWNAPTTLAEVTSYTVSRSDDAGATWTDFPATTELGYVDTTPAYETDYVYRIVANGATGSGEWVLEPVTTGFAHDLIVPAGPFVVDEGQSVGFQVSLDPGSDSEEVVVVETSNAMAAVPTETPVTIAPGMAATVTINALEDDGNSISEEVTITLRFGNQEKTVTVTITDNDPPAP